MARSGDFPEAAPSSEEPPAAPAAEVLARVIDEQRRAEAALQTRFLEHGLLDQAVGVLVARLECSPKEAFEQLLEIERRTGRDLLEVAGELVGQPSAARTRLPMGEAVPAYGRPGPARLERAGDGDELARLLLDDTLAWSGAVEAAIALIQPDGALELVGSAGVAARVVSQWRRIPPAMNCLINAAMREQAPVWADAAATSGRDAAAPAVLGSGGPGSPAPNPVHVAVPLRLGRGLIGAIEVAWQASTGFTAEVRREIAGLIESAAHGVVRSRRLADLPDERSGGGPDPAELDRLRGVIDASWEPALLVGPIEDEQDPIGGLRLVAMNRAARELLVGSAGPDPVGRRLAEAMPWAAVSGAIDAFREVLISGTTYRDSAYTYQDGADGRPRNRSVSISAVRLPGPLLYVSMRPLGDGQRDDQHEVAARMRRMTETGSWEWDSATGLVHWSPEALIAFGARSAPGPFPQDRPPYTVHPDDKAEHDRLMRALCREGRSAQGEFRIVRPDGAVRHMRVVGEPTIGRGGEVVSVFGTVQDVTEWRKAQTALEIAHIQLAAQRSRAESERQLANLLQQVIMPVEPIRVPAAAGLEIAARYRPASAGVGVGGDWYGILPLPDSRLLLTVGDIAGHGFGAATAMAQLFHALYGIALTGAGVGQLLRWLNAVTCSLPTFTIASACVALYDPADRRMRVANAGHPTPVLVRGGRAGTIPRPAGGTMLGVDPDSAYEQVELTVGEGDVLLLYTDGLIERRRHSPDENLERLLADASPVDPDLERYVDRILSRADSDTDDDTCILAVRFR